MPVGPLAGGRPLPYLTSQRGGRSPPAGSILYRGDTASGKLWEDPLDKGGSFEGVRLVETMPEGTVPRLHPAPLGDGEQSGGLKVINGHGSGLVDYLYSIGHAGWAVRWEPPSNGPWADPPTPGVVILSGGGWVILGAPDHSHPPAKTHPYCSNPVESHIYRPIHHGTLQVEEQNPRGR